VLFTIVGLYVNLSSAFPQNSNQDSLRHTINVFFTDKIGVGYIVPLTENAGLRVTVDYVNSFSDVHKENYYWHSGTSSDTSRHGQWMNCVYINFSMQWFQQVLKRNYLSLYLSWGLTSSYLLNEYDDYIINGNNEGHSSYAVIKSLALGGIFLFGLEAKLTRSFGVFAEYAFSCLYRWIPVRNYIDKDGPYSVEWNEWQFSLATAKIGLSIHL
jgi:hypothetical protein